MRISDWSSDVCSSDLERVLMPEGRVVISGFNPWSLWGASDRIPGLDPLLPVPAHMQVSLPRLKDWFKLLSFELDRGRFGCYAPPCTSQAWLDRWSFMDAAGDRWWRSEEHTSELQSLMRISYAVFCLKN